ncbi:uncharacterized protein LOC109715769 isoform X2 [Ananas comosus]|uniref:Uncharacterized protein LOC109704702 isoform X2 n=1 Tax=Ananas comosus TaxID=4615 RepID=A0A199V6S9_ANACO|nr:uncharacterized protein LOC109704702 isoform X2 [Ananas comosus]XP_020081062.1 uncharacterized protein LOC109704702 isoform X2 [Ananas comosus]XP_020096512.1 uncharacterized protein LOC109715769 isoform X2 [Ananas comosus]XP_020096513.1 uncharacterized protein LOC109715769 isoform X2 [Ananas comosus]OAY72779.1 hypothetical protein ACMD2_07768 [Ananas comosus]
MSSNEVRKVSRQDIQLVQNLIERCLQLYMDQKEVVSTLSYQAKIEPSFTELVWQKLEEENREFFKAYYVRLRLKNQIMIFNKLLEDQYRLMSKEYQSGVPSVPLSNGSEASTLHQSPSYLSEHIPTSTRQDNMLCNGGSSSGMMNGAPSGQQFILASKDVPGLPSGIDASSSLPSMQNSTIGRIAGVNGTAVKTEPSYSSNSDFAFCNDNAFLEAARPAIGDASGGSFSSSELTGQPLSDPLLDMDATSFGFLSQVPRNFSFSDLTEDFTQSADILENYGRSPFLPADGNNFSDSVGEEAENRRLDTISEGLSYENFGGD